jgi:hypothetical protein
MRRVRNVMLVVAVSVVVIGFGAVLTGGGIGF